MSMLLQIQSVLRAGIPRGWSRVGSIPGGGHSPWKSTGRLCRAGKMKLYLYQYVKKGVYSTLKGGSILFLSDSKKGVYPAEHTYTPLQWECPPRGFDVWHPAWVSWEPGCKGAFIIYVTQGLGEIYWRSKTKNATWRWSEPTCKWFKSLKLAGLQPASTDMQTNNLNFGLVTFCQV